MKVTTTDINKKGCITFLVSTLSANAFGRAYLLAEMMSPAWDIEFVGFHEGNIWRPCQNNRWPIKGVVKPGPNALSKEYRKSVLKLALLVEGNIVIACKVWPWIIDAAKIIQKRRGIPVILDIDDWELGWNFPVTPSSLIREIIYKLRNPEGLFFSWIYDIITQKIGFEKIVSNSFLQNRFNGTQVQHACDSDVMNPYKILDKDSCRKRFDLQKDAFYIGFIGTPRVHKGIDTIIEALAIIRKNLPEIWIKENKLSLIRFLVAGISEQESKDKIYDSQRDIIDFIHTFSKKELPVVVNCIDVSLMPQKDLPCCRGQLPAKLFDAMAMEKPVIASAVSDIPLIIEGAGIIIPPDSPLKLAEAIIYLWKNPKKIKKMGKNGRKKCVEKYSYKALFKILDKLCSNALYK